MSHFFTVKNRQPAGGGGDYELLEPGWYSFEIVNCYETDKDGAPLASKNGVPFFKIVCSELAREVVVFHYLFLDPEQAGKVSSFLAAIGSTYGDGERVEISAVDFVGQVFRGRVENKAGNDGIMRNRITRVAYVDPPTSHQNADSLTVTETEVLNDEPEKPEPEAGGLFDDDEKDEVPF